MTLPTSSSTLTEQSTLTSQQMRTLDKLVLECGNVDMNGIITQMVERGQMASFYTNLMGSNSSSTRCSKMVEVVNVVKKKGGEAYVHLYEAMCLIGGVNCDASQMMCAYLPFDYKTKNHMPEMASPHVQSPIVTSNPVTPKTNGHVLNGLKNGYAKNQDFGTPVTAAVGVLNGNANKVNTPV